MRLFWNPKIQFHLPKDKKVKINNHQKCSSPFSRRLDDIEQKIKNADETLRENHSPKFMRYGSERAETPFFASICTKNIDCPFQPLEYSVSPSFPMIDESTQLTNLNHFSSLPLYLEYLKNNYEFNINPINFLTSSLSVQFFIFFYKKFTIDPYFDWIKKQWGLLKKIQGEIRKIINQTPKYKQDLENIQNSLNQSNDSDENDVLTLTKIEMSANDSEITQKEYFSPLFSNSNSKSWCVEDFTVDRNSACKMNQNEKHSTKTCERDKKITIVEIPDPENNKNSVQQSPSTLKPIKKRTNTGKMNDTSNLHIHLTYLSIAFTFFISLLSVLTFFRPSLYEYICYPFDHTYFTARNPFGSIFNRSSSFEPNFAQKVTESMISVYRQFIFLITVPVRLYTSLFIDNLSLEYLGTLFAIFSGKRAFIWYWYEKLASMVVLGQADQLKGTSSTGSFSTVKQSKNAQKNVRCAFNLRFFYLAFLPIILLINCVKFLAHLSTWPIRSSYHFLYSRVFVIRKISRILGRISVFKANMLETHAAKRKFYLTQKISKLSQTESKTLLIFSVILTFYIMMVVPNTLYRSGFYFIYSFVVCVNSAIRFLYSASIFPNVFYLFSAKRTTNLTFSLSDILERYIFAQYDLSLAFLNPLEQQIKQFVVYLNREDLSPFTSAIPIAICGANQSDVSFYGIKMKSRIFALLSAFLLLLTSGRRIGLVGFFYGIFFCDILLFIIQNGQQNKRKTELQSKFKFAQKFIESLNALKLEIYRLLVPVILFIQQYVHYLAIRSYLFIRSDYIKNRANHTDGEYSGLSYIFSLFKGLFYSVRSTHGGRRLRDSSEYRRNLRMRTSNYSAENFNNFTTEKNRESQSDDSKDSDDSENEQNTT